MTDFPFQSMPGVAVTDTAQKPYPSYIYKSTKNWVKKVLAIYHAAFDQVGGNQSDTHQTLWA